ncbi:uncharacterized protein TNCV_2861151 [Trichonephila clavipes]|nr:uncharacterized protein TNCV_2861151 [Trichonephila clavipes]
MASVMTAFSQISAQTTTTTPTTTAGTATSITTAETNNAAASTTPSPQLTTEAGGTTLTAADSAAPTTTVVTESSNLEATTEGQASNDALRASGLRRGYRFESTRNKPLANQEATPAPEETTSPPKTEDKKIAWKFGRGGNNQEGWSVRPAPNSGYPLWKKEAPASNGAAPQVDQGVNANSKKNNDQQAYIVWNVGQGNGGNGWNLNGAPEGWAPGGTAPVSDGWAPADASVGGTAGAGGWNAGGWVEDQPADEEEAQEGWVEEEPTPEGNIEGGWAPQAGAPQQAGWTAPNGNAGGWTNGPPQAPVVNVPQPNGWAAQPNAPQTNGWDSSPVQQDSDGGGWIAPQQGGNGWAPQQAGNVQPGAPPPAAANGWNTGPAQVENNGWTQNADGWAAPAANSGWNNNAPPGNGGGWSNGQSNTGGWSNGLQDAGLSWKVYNEDTKTMENLDDNSGWKVVGDGGTDGWKLVDEKGNVEWRIENVNGEWKVTSADELPAVDNSTAPITDAANATSEATNTTSEEITATTPSPTGGWDDDKQGRYIVWKFSEDGKGEARVYGGDGAEPEVWSVGDNNQYWKETMSIKSNDNNGQGANSGWNTNGAVWQNDGGWQDTYQPGSDSWQNGGANAPQQQNNGWKNGGGAVSPQVTGNGWQNGGAAAPAGISWKTGTNGAVKPDNGRGWQTGNGAQQNGGNGWQQKAPISKPQTTTWSNIGSIPQQGGGWKNQQPQAPAAWNGGNASPQSSGGWQNGAPVNQPANGGWKNANAGSQTGWQNGGAAPQANGGWAPGTNGRKQRTKGRWRDPSSRGRNANNGWQANKQANAKKNGARGSWNNRNKASSWAQGNGGATSTSWNTGPSPSVAPATNNNPTNVVGWQNGGNKAGVSGGWTANSKNGQTVPYIIVIKTADGAAPAQGVSNPWSNGGGHANAKKNRNGNGNKPRNNRRSSGWKMNRAGSSGWQWNPQGGSEGWKWMDGWMGSGGGFGGWMGDKDTMYSGWRPTKTNGASSAASKSPNQRIGTGPKASKKGGGKMVFVFGTKRNSSGGLAKPNGRKKGKQVIILDYTTAGKKAPKGDDGMKKDIESVIKALKSGKPTNIQGSTRWKQGPQAASFQQWGG